MKDPKKEILQLEYQELSSSMRTFMGYRLTILGFSITIIGVLFTHLVSSDFYKSIALEACLFFIIFALIRTMKSITRHLLIYALQLRELESELSYFGYWNKWLIYLPESPQDSKSKAISMLLRILNLIVLIFIIVTNTWVFMQSNDDTENIITVAFSSLIVFGFIFNFIELNSKLNPNNHFKEISQHWASIKKQKKAAK